MTPPADHKLRGEGPRKAALSSLARGFSREAIAFKAAPAAEAARPTRV